MAELKMFSQEAFQCSVCLDLLKEPVTISCGHSYCRSCITDCWNQEDEKKIYSCPQCRHTFSPRPALATSTVLSEMLETLKITPSAELHAGAGDVPCDACTGSEYKAVKSCLECQESFCLTHLQLHQELHSQRHRMIEATDRLQEMFCSTHRKLLEVFCRTDQQCVCVLCVMDQHKDHDTVSAAAQRTEAQKKLIETLRQFQQKIQQRERDLHRLRNSVKSCKISALKAVEETEKICAEMIQSIQRRRDVLKQQIRDQEETAVSDTERILEKLQQEISDLKRKHGEMEKLLPTLDDISFIQSFLSLSAPPESTDVPFASLFSVGDVTKSLHQLRTKLEEFCDNEMKTIYKSVTNIDHWSRRNFLRYSRQFTLDMNTMHNLLRLSEGNKVVYSNSAQPYPDHPNRFGDHYQQVLCEESVSGRCYWELDVTGKDVCISVSYKSISRKGRSQECVFGCNDQSWSLSYSSSAYSSSEWIYKHNNIETKLSVCDSSSSSIRRVGVFVDHDAGSLSFYSVSDTMRLIHRVHTTFTQPLCPGLSVQKSSSYYSYSSDSSVKLCDVSG